MRRDCCIQGKVMDGNGDVTFCVCQETIYTTVLFVPMAFLLRMLMAYSPRLVPFSSFRSGFLRINIFHKVRTNSLTREMWHWEKAMLLNTVSRLLTFRLIWFHGLLWVDTPVSAILSNKLNVQRSLLQGDRRERYIATQGIRQLPSLTAWCNLPFK